MAKRNKIGIRPGFLIFAALVSLCLLGLLVNLRKPASQSVAKKFQTTTQPSATAVGTTSTSTTQLPAIAETVVTNQTTDESTNVVSVHIRPTITVGR